MDGGGGSSPLAALSSTVAKASPSWRSSRQSRKSWMARRGLVRMTRAMVKPKLAMMARTRAPRPGAWAQSADGVGAAFMFL